MTAMPCHTSPFLRRPPSRANEVLSRLLRGSRWMGALAPAEVARVEREIQVRFVPSGTSLVRRGEPAEHWMGVADGLVKISACNAEGRSTTFAGIPTGGWFGEESLMRNEGRRYDATAIRDAVVALVPRGLFVDLMESNLGFNRFLFAQLNERLGQFLAMLENERLLPPESRVARGIAALVDPAPDSLAGRCLHISQEEIGYFVGVSRQRVNQALKALEQRGLLKVGYGSLVVRDLEALRALT